MAIINNVPNTTNNSQWRVDEYGYGTGDYWDIRIKANKGYKFAGDCVASYTNKDGEPVNKTVGVNGAKTMCSVYIYDATEDTEITITGQTVDGTIVTVHCEINNATATGKITATDTAQITVTCNDGFVFDNAPKVSYTNYYGYPYEKAMTLNEDKTVATITLTDFDENEDATVTGETVSAGTPELTVTNNIVGTTETHTYDGTTATFEVLGNKTKFRFINPTVSYTDTSGNVQTVALSVEILSYSQKATATVTDIDPTKTVTLSGSYLRVVHLQSTLNNCQSAEVLPDFYLQGSHVEMTLTANENTVFNTAPTLSHQDKFGRYVIVDFTVSADKKTATVAYNLPTEYEVDFLDVSATAEPVQVIGGNYGAINVYAVTLDNLADFAKVRFFRATSTGGDTQYEYIDLGKYVNSIKRVFCNVPTLSTDTLMCGNYSTNIEVLQPATDRITLDFGNVTIPSHNEDVTDYQSEIKMFIPFTGFVDISPDYAGEQINLQMEINVITGNGVAKLSYNGVVFQVVEITPSQNIIYRTADTELTVIGSDDWNEMLYYGVEPYIYCKWFESVNPTGRNADNRRGVIGTFHGFNTFSDVTIIATPAMLADEQTAIYNALQRGVYIE